jgi:hypothetical protein
MADRVKRARLVRGVGVMAAPAIDGFGGKAEMIFSERFRTPLVTVETGRTDRIQE